MFDENDGKLTDCPTNIGILDAKAHGNAAASHKCPGKTPHPIHTSEKGSEWWTCVVSRIPLFTEDDSLLCINCNDIFSDDKGSWSEMVAPGD
jgi:hypothetical protein